MTATCGRLGAALGTTGSVGAFAALTRAMRSQRLAIYRSVGRRDEPTGFSVAVTTQLLETQPPLVP